MVVIPWGGNWLGCGTRRDGQAANNQSSSFCSPLCAHPCLDADSLMANSVGCTAMMLVESLAIVLIHLSDC